MLATADQMLTVLHRVAIKPDPEIELTRCLIFALIHDLLTGLRSEDYNERVAYHVRFSEGELDYAIDAVGICTVFFYEAVERYFLGYSADEWLEEQLYPVGDQNEDRKV